MKKLEYKSNVGNDSKIIIYSTIFIVIGFFCGFFINEPKLSFTSFIVSIGLIIIACVVSYKCKDVLKNEALMLYEIEQSNLEINREEQIRIHKEMELLNKVEKKERLEKEKIEKKLLLADRQQLKIDRQLELENIKHENKLKKLQGYNNLNIIQENQLDIFDSSCMSILNPLIKQAKKEKRRITGQEFIQTILKGMK